MAGMTCITSDLDYYTIAFATLMSKTSQNAVDWIKESFDEVVVKHLAGNLKGRTPLNVLGIGSGPGNVDCAMIEKLLPSFPKIENTIVEPSEAELTLYKQLVTQKQTILKDVTFDWRKETVDQFVDGINNGGGPKFHFIHAIHVLYYATDLKNVIRVLHDSLEEGGLLLIIVVSHKATPMKIHDRFPRLRELISYSVLTDAVVKSALESLNMAYTDHLVTRNLEGSSCYDETSLEGNHLLDFLTQTKNFRQTAPDDLREGVLAYLKSPDCLREVDGEMKMYRDWVYFTVTK